MHLTVEMKLTCFELEDLFLISVCGIVGKSQKVHLITIVICQLAKTSLLNRRLFDSMGRIKIPRETRIWKYGSYQTNDLLESASH